MRYLSFLFIMLVLMLGSVGLTSQAWQGKGNTITGKVELLNVEKLANGQSDASGVVIWLNPLEASLPTGLKKTVEMKQKGRTFIPHIVVVQVGSSVDFPNEDPFFHNVFSSFNGKIFDLGLYQKGESRLINFNRPGICAVFCSIHPKMNGVIIAVKTPYYAITDKEGNFQISDLPKGNYKLHVWHERATEQTLDNLVRTVSIGGPLTISDLKIDETGYVPLQRPNKYNYKSTNE